MPIIKDWSSLVEQLKHHIKHHNDIFFSDGVRFDKVLVEKLKDQYPDLEKNVMSDHDHNRLNEALGDIVIGSQATVSGIYCCTKCPHEMLITEGETLPPIQHVKNSSCEGKEWKLVVAVESRRMYCLDGAYKLSKHPAFSKEISQYVKKIVPATPYSGMYVVDDGEREHPHKHIVPAKRNLTGHATLSASATLLITPNNDENKELLALTE